MSKVDADRRACDSYHRFTYCVCVSFSVYVLHSSVSVLVCFMMTDTRRNACTFHEFWTLSSSSESFPEVLNRHLTIKKFLLSGIRYKTKIEKVKNSEIIVKQSFDQETLKHEENPVT